MVHAAIAQRTLKCMGHTIQRPYRLLLQRSHLILRMGRVFCDQICVLGNHSLEGVVEDRGRASGQSGQSGDELLPGSKMTAAWLRS